MTYTIAAAALIFGILRFIVPVTGAVNKADFFKDFAHLFVGFAFGYGVLEPCHYSAWIALALTITEGVAFFVRKKPVLSGMAGYRDKDGIWHPLGGDQGGGSARMIFDQLPVGRSFILLNTDGSECEPRTVFKKTSQSRAVAPFPIGEISINLKKNVKEVICQC